MDKEVELAYIIVASEEIVTIQRPDSQREKEKPEQQTGMEKI